LLYNDMTLRVSFRRLEYWRGALLHREGRISLAGYMPEDGPRLCTYHQSALKGKVEETVSQSKRQVPQAEVLVSDSSKLLSAQEIRV
jgi:hypothetical protein